ncbi:FRG domain-containing protein [Saccharothrix sp. Mg75]|uniref:FRG domain-containing protein n=1 Tax=Saccharothrix sp. Mg75 TaxID=3445357 RepID=UPI003EEAAC05
MSAVRPRHAASGGGLDRVEGVSAESSDQSHSVVNGWCSMPKGTPGEICCVEDLLEVLEDTAAFGTRWYRGHVDQRWPLVPSLARRREWLEAEREMVKRFKQDAHSRLRYAPDSEWGWVFLAQHHGLPTRLLDWTENPLVGLYFAVERDSGQDDKRADGRFFILRPRDLNASTVSADIDMLMFGHDELLNDYLPENVSKKPSMAPVAAIANRTFGRIIAQSGTFTVNHRSHAPLESSHGADCIDSWVVPVQYKERIRQQLRAINISAMSVYPDLNTLAAYVKGMY